LTLNQLTKFIISTVVINGQRNQVSGQKTEKWINRFIPECKEKIEKGDCDHHLIRES